MLIGNFEAIAIVTGWSEWKLSKVNGCNIKMVHFRPYVGIAKMSLRAWEALACFYKLQTNSWKFKQFS